VKSMQPFKALNDRLPDALHYPVWAVAAILALLKILAPLLPGLVAARRLSDRVLRALACAFLLVGAVLYFGYFNVGSSELYFLWYALLPASILAAIGWMELLRPLELDSPARARALGFASALLLLLWVVDLPRQISSPVFWDNLNHQRVDEPRYQALRWLEQHSDVRDVVAYDGLRDPDRCYVTAYAERRALAGCYFGLVPEKMFGPMAQLRELLPAETFRQYRDRALLNRRILVGSAAAARRAAAAYGVRYVLFVDTSPATRAAIRRLRMPVVFHSGPESIVKIVSPPA
jgi:hypothetical protein